MHRRFITNAYYVGGARFPPSTVRPFKGGDIGLFRVKGLRFRIQVPNNHTLTQNPYYTYYDPKPKYLIIGYLDPWGIGLTTY